VSSHWRIGTICSVSFPVHNWAKLPRVLAIADLPQLSKASCINKYLQQITLPPINVSKRPNDDENDPPKAIVNLWHSDRWSTEELPLADWPMPDNITNFESINLRFAYTNLGHVQKIFWD
jgi:hypothetical protein